MTPSFPARIISASPNHRTSESCTREERRRQTGPVVSKPFPLPDLRSPFKDPLTEWMKDKHLAFKNFEAQNTPIHSFSSEYFPNHHSRNMLAHSSNSDLSPKAKVSYDENKFSVEFDVGGYSPEELSIKTEGDVLIVVAKHESKKESGASFVSKQFEQRFSLPPGVKSEAITSHLGRDGILVVTALREIPKVSSSSLTSSSSSPSSLLTQTPLSKTLSVSSGNDENEVLEPRVKYDDDKFTIRLDVRNYTADELDVKVEESNIVITAKKEIKESSGTRTRVFEQKFSVPSGVHPEKLSSNLDANGFLTISAPRDSGRFPIEHHMDRILSPNNWSKRDESFREPRSSHTLTENDKYKIIINVSEYQPEELIIKTIGSTVFVEAKHEDKTEDGHSYNSRNFSQSFTLPPGVHPEKVTSNLSKSGILTISAPMTHSYNSSERLVPIKHS